MKMLLSNRYANAAAKTIVFFGIIHLIILGFLTYRESIYVLNAFTILNLDSFIPGLGDGMVNFVLSWCVVLAVYCCAYIYLSRSMNEEDES